MNLNLKMTVEQSKRRSYFLSLVFITKCFTKNLLLRKLFEVILFYGCILNQENHCSGSAKLPVNSLDFGIKQVGKGQISTVKI